MSATEKPTGLALLRVPFPANQISKLPKPTIPNEEWKRLPKGKCKECDGFHALTKTIHLSYVGHAALTDRLLDADPAWTWEPLALGSDGYPRLDEHGGMWIKLTVCGVTRMGYGDAQGKTGGNAVKERIGDALRNAAMRFGAALELWHKGDLHDEEEDKQDHNALADKIIASNVIPNADAGKDLTEPQKSRVKALSDEIVDAYKAGYLDAGVDAIDGMDPELEMGEKLYLWSLLDSPIRSGIKKIQSARRTATLKAEEATQP